MEIKYDNQTKFTWGIQDIDKKFGKPDRRELIVLFGYMSAGKTEFAYFVARANADLWSKTLYLSLELPEYDMKLRICRKKAGVSKYQFQTNDYTDQQKMIMDDERKRLEEQTNVVIWSPEIKNLANIERAIKSGYDNWCRIFIVDNLDKIIAEWREDENSRYQRITTFFQDLKNSMDACIIVVHHAKKPDSKWYSYKKAGLSWMRWSQKIMDNATQVFEIYRDLDPEETDPTQKAKVELTQIKDTFEWANGLYEIYFYKWNYYDENWFREAKFWI